MRITQRQVTITLLIMLVLMSLVILVIQFSTRLEGFTVTVNIATVLLISALLAAYWRGWEYARYATVVLFTLAVGIATPEPYVTERFTQGAFIPPVLALIMAGPAWVIGSAASIIAILVFRAGGHGIYTDPLALTLFAISIGGIILARLVTETAHHEAETQMARAEAARAESEARARDVSHKAAELERQVDEQRRLLDLIATLETPVVALAEGVLLAPIVGHLDSQRAEGLIARLLREVAESRARLVVLDIAGVPTVDTQVASALLRAVQAVRLLGCDVTITGISASVATTITLLGISMADVRTARTPQEAL